MYWSARPFVRIVFIFVAGILSYYFFPPIRQHTVFLYLSVIILLTIAAIITQKKSDIRFNPLKGLVFASLIYAFGLFTADLHFSKTIDKPIYYEGTFSGIIIQQPVEKTNSFKAVVEIRQCFDTNLALPFKSLIYFQKNDQYQLQYGNRILFHALIKPPEPPKNPGEFNYKNFLNYQNINQVAYVKKISYRIIDNQTVNPVKKAALQLRNRLLQSLQANGITGKDYAVAAAILLGYDALMNDEIRENYQKAGAMHVLCVSGLHAGIIYLVFNFLLSFLKKNKSQKILKVVLLLIIVWFYAFLTGLSPSILRATVMISFFIVGNEMKRDKEAYNTLAMSAFFLLLYNPGFIFNVGFQLSYAAVLGIITFYRPINNLVWSKFGLVRKLWSVMAVSIAAQLGTFPLAAHYFHTFPSYFLLTNLIIFPFSFLIITGGLLFIFVSWIPVVAHWAALLLSGMIYLMNLLVNKVAGLPGSAIQDLYFPWIKVVLTYGIILFTFLLLQTQQKKYLFLTLSAVLLFLINQTIHRYQTLRQQKILVYDLKNNGRAIDLIHGNNHVLLTDLQDHQKIFYYTENLRIQSGLKPNIRQFSQSSNTALSGLYLSDDFLSFNGLRMAMPHQFYYPTPKPLKVDRLWLTAGSFQTPEKLSGIFDFKEVILGSDLNAGTRKKWLRYLTKKGIPFYDIHEKGCLIIDLTK